MRGEAPYVDHAWRHLPGGTDPLDINAAMDIGYPYFGLHDITIGDLVNADTGGPFFPVDDSGAQGATALYAGANNPDNYIHPAPFNVIIGIGAWQYAPSFADFDITGATQLTVYPTWSIGTDRPFVFGRKVGTGVIKQFSETDEMDPDPDVVPTYQFDLIQYDRYLQFRMQDDGSRVDATNPIAWAERDEISCYWHMFLKEPDV